ncbi:MAG: ABC transporter ATP-binding protein [Candidatus Aegiribacteria sp.]|nr:ABC transporter ATP-binding protein [Candidatus Aegiribacteria sp.]
MISLKDIKVTFKDFQLGPLHLEIPESVFFILMGPTGSGKTLLLETIAGIVRQDTGTIEIKGIDVTETPPGKRNIGIVYQDTALFPHLSVRQNIMYGVRYSQDTIEYDFDKLVEFLDLERLLDRLPGKLSGGEKQRTALARALIIDPGVILLDEPLSSLDQMFKGEIRSELRRLHSETAVTFLMTTHDFTDALSMGTHGAVIRDGKIEQTGTIDEIFYSPKTPFMASFVGMKNIFPAEFSENGAFVEGHLVRHTSNKSGHGFLAIPPEAIVVSRETTVTSERNHYTGTIISVERTGSIFSISVNCGNLTIISSVTRSALSELNLTEGQDVYISFKASAVHVF